MRNSKCYKDIKDQIPTPAYIVYEDRIINNLEILKRVEKECAIKIIMAFKANALWKTFPIVTRYFNGAAVSSLNELQLAIDYFGKEIFAYCPVYRQEDFNTYLQNCTHITFNSIAQYQKFASQINEYKASSSKQLGIGLRVNPKCSVVDHDIYNPAVSGSRFGVALDKMPEILPEGIDGFHLHALCESNSHDFERVLNSFESQFGKYLDKIKWINFGGGHLITRSDYDVPLLKKIMSGFHERYPDIEVYIEPGSAFMWQTGDLITTVLDVVEDDGIKTAIIDASFACHMPDCLEMPYKPNIEEAAPDSDSEYYYRLGGNTCLTGDYVGDWNFDHPLQAGERLTLLDMNHYTTVKTNMFNGVRHPSIWLIDKNGNASVLREYTYEDYRDRMD